MREAASQNETNVKHKKEFEYKKRLYIENTRNEETHKMEIGGRKMTPMVSS